MAHHNTSHNNSDHSSKSDKSKQSSRNGVSGNETMMPSVSPTLASLVGAGVAIGIGLYATRRSWMPIAEDLNKQIQGRWDAYMHSENKNSDTPMSDYAEKSGKAGANATPSAADISVPHA